MLEGKGASVIQGPTQNLFHKGTAINIELSGKKFKKKTGTVFCLLYAPPLIKAP